MTYPAVAVIAGTGHLPKILTKALQEAGRRFMVLAYAPYTNADWVATIPHVWLQLGQIGKALHIMKENALQEIVLVGGFLPRPFLKDLGLDLKGAAWLARLGMRWKGDDRFLIHLAKLLEAEGLTLKSPQDFLPSIIAPAGAVGRLSPSPENLQDAHMGIKILTHLSPWDFGQGLAIQQGLILGIEAAEGTNACIQRCGSLKQWGNFGPIYVKQAKVQQDMRLDLPVIGPSTVKALVEGGFQGLIFQAHKTLLVFTQEMRESADAGGIFLWGVDTVSEIPS